MSKNIVVVNAGPRKGYNTDTLLQKASEAAKENGFSVIDFDLFKLEKYTGCVSCFGCKTNKNKSNCVHKDGLTPVIEAIKNASGLIIGSPIYLSDVTASFRALYERIVFMNLTYTKENPCCNENKIPVLLLMTSNAPDSFYTDLLKSYEQTFNTFIGKTTTFISGETLQVKDYSRLDWPWTMFDVDKKIKRHEEVFPLECEKVYSLAKDIFVLF